MQFVNPWILKPLLVGTLSDISSSADNIKGQALSEKTVELYAGLLKRYNDIKGISLDHRHNYILNNFNLDIKAECISEFTETSDFLGKVRSDITDNAESLIRNIKAL